MDVIEFTTVEKIKKEYHDKDVYSLRQNGKHVWLQRLCFKILEKLKCNNALYHTTEVKRKLISPKSVMDALYRQKSIILDQAHELQGIVYMGQEEFFRLSGEVNLNKAISFTAPYSHSVYGHGYQVFGMKICVIPWIKGIFVLPKI